MAKNNYNYFTQGIDRYGSEEFLNYKNMKDMERDVPNILRQLAKRRIDLDVYGHYFLKKNLMDGVIHVSLDTLRDLYWDIIVMDYYIGSLQYYGYPVDDYLLNKKRNALSKYNAYNLIYIRFMEAKNSNSLNPIIALASELQSNITLGNSI